MKDVFDKTEGKLYEELKELSFQMMLNETNKLQIENNCHLEVVNAHKYSHYTAQERIETKEKDLLLADKEGFALSLAFDELLLSNGYKFNAFKSGPNAVKIWAENFLNKYELSYPLSWEFAYEDDNGLHYRYHKLDEIEDNHQKFLTQVDKLNITEYEKKRILAVANYYKQTRKLLTKYINDENLNEEAEKGHTR